MLWKTRQSGSVLSQTMSFGVSYGAAASVPRWTLTNCQIKPLGPLAVLEGSSEVLSTALSPSGFLASLGIFHICLQQSFTVLQQSGFWDGTCSTSWMVGRRAAAVHSRGDRHGNIRHLNMCHESYKSSQNFNWKKTKQRTSTTHQPQLNSLYSKGTAADLYTLGIHFRSKGRWVSCIVVNGSCAAK